MFMRRIKHWLVAAAGFDANVILPGVFIGSVSSATDLNSLKKHQITHILTILHNAQPNRFPNDIVYHVIKAIDDESTNMLEYLEEALHFIDEARSKGGSVLVHCHAGMSRSGSVVIALVMRDKQISFKEAWAFVAEGRSIVRPIEHFRKQLLLFEKLGFKVDKTHPDYIQFCKEQRMHASLTQLHDSAPSAALYSVASLSASFIDVLTSQIRSQPCDSKSSEQLQDQKDVDVIEAKKITEPETILSERADVPIVTEQKSSTDTFKTETAITKVDE